jgi:hypothetical protein
MNPSAIAPARRTAGSAKPPIQIGGPPDRGGFGVTDTRRRLGAGDEPVRPCLAQDRDRVDQPRAPRPKRDAQALELLLPPAQAEPEGEAAVAQQVDGGGVLGQP